MTDTKIIRDPDNNAWETHDRNGRIWTGIFFVIVGAVALARSFMVPMPEWLFTWQTLLIALGLFIGVRSKFHGAAWFILILIGGIFLLSDFYFAGNLRRIIWPVIIIAIGAVFILRPKKNNWRRRFGQEQWELGNTEGTAGDGFSDITIVFGSTKKKIESKKFTGGDITSIFGGAELDLTEADIKGKAVIDITALFGGVELIIPSNWTIQSEVVSVFGSVRDNRTQPATIAQDPDKIIILDGTALFGGIEIKSFAK